MAFVLVNSRAYDWSNITVSFLGSPISQIVKINYGSKQTKSNNYGIFDQPISRSYSNITYDGSMELYLDVWRSICQAAPNGDPLAIPMFQITINYGNFGTDGGSVIACKDVLYNCEFLDNPMSASQGETGIKVTIPIIFAGFDRFIN